MTKERIKAAVKLIQHDCHLTFIILQYFQACIWESISRNIRNTRYTDSLLTCNARKPARPCKSGGGKKTEHHDELRFVK